MLCTTFHFAQFLHGWVNDRWKSFLFMGAYMYIAAYINNKALSFFTFREGYLHICLSVLHRVINSKCYYVLNLWSLCVKLIGALIHKLFTQRQAWPVVQALVWEILNINYTKKWQKGKKSIINVHTNYYIWDKVWDLTFEY